MKLTTQRFLLIFLSIDSTFLATTVAAVDETESVQKHKPVEGLSRKNEARAIYSPQLELTEWVPMGRGDPLKNDPTYDYVPPKLDAVKYWADGTGHKEKSKNDILMLGMRQSSPLSRTKDIMSKHSASRRNFAYDDLPTMVIPPHQTLTKSSMDTYQIPTFIHNRKGVNDVKPFNKHYKNYDFSSQPPTSYSTQGHRYRFPTQSNSLKSHLSNHYFLQKPPKEQLLSESSYFPSFAHLPSQFTKPFLESTTHKTEIVDAQSINYEFTYETTQPTTSTTTTTTTHKPSPPPPSTTEPTTTSTTTSMYTRFEKPTKSKLHMSFIIEGHSKVKTYGHGSFIDPRDKLKPRIVPVFNNENPVVYKVYGVDEDGKEIAIKHIHTPPNPKTESKKVDLMTEGKEKSQMESLLSFLDNSFGGLLSNQNSSEEYFENNDLRGQKEEFREVRNEPFSQYKN